MDKKNQIINTQHTQTQTHGERKRKNLRRNKHVKKKTEHRMLTVHRGHYMIGFFFRKLFSKTKQMIIFIDTHY